jgi:hypothetical protein
LPDKKQFYQMVDKATDQIKRQAHGLKLYKLNPKVYGAKAYASARQKAKQQADKAK